MAATSIPGAPGLRVGGTLGPYRLEALLGEGAMGLVFRAERVDDGAVVALKVLKKVLSRNEAYRRRFLREATVAREIRSNHLVPVLDAGEADGYHFLAMRHVSGTSLAGRLEAEGRLDPAEAVRLAAELGAGLDALHAHGIVHRDVKPANVMVDEAGRAALTDFGLAKGPAFTVLTRPGQVMGTLDYIAPELIEGREATPASDVYALGCLVYECLTGSAPFADRRLLEVAVAHLEEEPPDPRERRPELAAQLAVTVLLALAKRPDARPRTATAYANLLRAAAAARG